MCHVAGCLGSIEKSRLEHMAIFNSLQQLACSFDDHAAPSDHVNARNSEPDHGNISLVNHFWGIVLPTSSKLVLLRFDFCSNRN